MKTMGTVMEQEIKRLDEGISDVDPLRDLIPFIISQDKLKTSFAVKDQIASIGPTLPSTMLLGALRDPRLRLLAPLTITFEREESNIVACCEELEEFGFGTHLTEAIEDLQATIAELYFALKEENDRLGPKLGRLGDSLRQKIKEIL